MSITVKKTLKIRNKTTNQFEPLAALRGRDGADGQQGPQGISGATGPQGPAGEDGHTPTTEEIEEVCADALADITTELEEAKRKIKFLDEMSKGQLYDFEEKSESGTSVSPSGAKYQSLLAVDGKTEQTKYNGYNLFSNQADEIVDNLYLTQNGSTVGFQGYNYSVVLNCDANTTYTISREVISERFRVASVASIPTAGTAPTDAKQVSDGGSSVTITTTDTSRYLIINLSTVITTFRNQLASLMVEKGSTAHSYEPYVGGIPSPNPSYPQEVKGIEELNVRVGSRQLYNEYLQKEDTITSGYTNNGVTYTSSAPCVIHAKGTSNGTSASYSRTASNLEGYVLSLPKYKKGTYVISSSSSNSKVSVVWSSDGTTWENKSISGSSTLVLNEDSYVGLRVFVSVGVTIDEDIYVMLEYGSTAHPYEPFSEETRTIIPPKPLYKVGDYADRLDVNSGEWVYNTKSTTLSGSKSWGFSDLSSGNKLFYTSNTITDYLRELDIVTCVSSLYRAVPNASGSASFNYASARFCMAFRANRNDATLQLFVEDSRFSTINEFKSWLADNVVDVTYVLAEPETSPIADADLEWLKSFDGLATDKVWTITDQDGNDVSYLLKYIVKTSEV